ENGRTKSADRETARPPPPQGGCRIPATAEKQPAPQPPQRVERELLSHKEIGATSTAGDPLRVRTSGAKARHTVSTRRTEAARRDVPANRLNALVALQSARIARTLHDDTSQVLASAHCAIEDVTQDLPEPLQARLHRVRKHLHDVAEQLRRISHDLHPGILDDF